MAPSSLTQSTPETHHPHRLSFRWCHIPRRPTHRQHRKILVVFDALANQAHHAVFTRAPLLPTNETTRTDTSRDATAALQALFDCSYPRELLSHERFGSFPTTTVNNGRVGARCCSLKRPSIGIDGGHRNRSEKPSRRLHNVRFCIVPRRARVLTIAVLNYFTQTTLGNKLMTTD